MEAMTSAESFGMGAIYLLVGAAVLFALWLFAQDMRAKRAEYSATSMRDVFGEQVDDADLIDDYDEEDYLDDGEYDVMAVRPISPTDITVGAPRPSTSTAMANITAYNALSQRSGAFFKVIRAENVDVPEFNPLAQRAIGTAPVLPTLAFNPNPDVAPIFVPNSTYVGRHRTDVVSGTRTQQSRGYSAQAPAPRRHSIPVIPGPRRELVGVS